jgi:integrase
VWATTTSPADAYACAPRRRSSGAPCGSSCPTCSPRRFEATLGPREDRDLDAPLFPGAGKDRLRTAIIRACKAAGMPTFSPHDLRHRRISLLHRQGRSWAEIGRFVDQRKLSVTADTYTHVLVDGREADYVTLLAA